MKTNLTYLLTAVSWTLLLAGCTKEPAERNDEEHEDRAVNVWIFNTLKNNYLWSLQSDWLTANSDPQYNQDYSTFFKSALQQPPAGYADNAPHDGYYYEGRWVPYSYITMKNPAARSVSGLQSFGFEFGLWGYFDGLVFAYVLYVVPGSPAEKAGLQRGDWIQKVNDRDMPEGSYEVIYPEMIASASVTTVKLGLVDFTYQGRSGNIIYFDKSTGRDITLTADEVEDDPVFLREIITAANGTKIGYMVYNGFQRGRDPATLEDDVNDTTYEDALREAFEYFRDNDAGELVIDLRYNPGGYNVTCLLLASLIRPAQSVMSELFVQYQSRSYLGTGRFDPPGYYEYFMTTTTNDNLPGTDVQNYPGFSSVYILTSNRTASASEMLINGLRGAERGIEVHVIGGTTAGKNVGSSVQERTVDGKEYTMYPIMFQNFNAEGESNFANGFAPGTNSGSVSSYVLDELNSGLVVNQAYGLKAWGSPDDPLLGRAIGVITGTPLRSAASDNRVVQGAEASARSIAGTLRILPESSLDRKPVRGSIRITEDF